MAGKILIFTSMILMILGPWQVDAYGWKNDESVLLKDIDVLTLKAGKMTNARRSSPVPQLECVGGGTASCDAFRPRVVQCYNRGFDGVDVQWECKTDMDNDIRFGEIEVSCEGYNHRDDPFVLRGSCGLRYNLDYTKEGLNNQKGSGKSFFSSSWSSHHSYYVSKKGSNVGLIVIAIIVIVIYVVYRLYKKCMRWCSEFRQNAFSNRNNDYPHGGGGGSSGGSGNVGGGGYGWFGGQGPGGSYPNTGSYPSAPPHPDYQDDASCRNRTYPDNSSTNNRQSGNNDFWTGAATGGLFGYLFGSRNSEPRQHTGFDTSSSRGYGSTSSRSSGSKSTHTSSSLGGGSSGTRTASGFGGTSRR